MDRSERTAKPLNFGKLEDVTQKSADYSTLKAPNTAQFGEANLVLNEKGAVYHLGLRPEQISNRIIVVGDPSRPRSLATELGIDLKSNQTIKTGLNEENRSLTSITGTIRHKGSLERLSIVTHGMGTCAEIVFSELRALAEIDLDNRRAKTDITPLKIIRLGTSGSISGEDLGSVVLSTMSVDFTGVSREYVKLTPKEIEFEQALEKHLRANLNPELVNRIGELLANPNTSQQERTSVEAFLNRALAFRPYEVDSKILGNILEIAKAGKIDLVEGVTASAAGFFDTQGRNLFNRPSLYSRPFDAVLRDFEFQGEKSFSNFEMESAILQSVFNGSKHQTATLTVSVANRPSNTFADKRKLGDSFAKAAKLAKDWLFQDDQ